MTLEIDGDGPVTPTNALAADATPPRVVQLGAGVEVPRVLEETATAPAGEVLAPRSLTERDSLYWRIAAALPALMELLPLSERDRREFEVGFLAGIPLGVKEAIDAIGGIAQWYRTTMLELLVAMTDVEFYEAAAEDVRDAFHSGRPLDNEHILEYFAEHAPATYRFAVALDNLETFPDRMLAKFVGWAGKSDGLLDLAARMRAQLLSLYLVNLSEFLARQAKLSRNRTEQGKALGVETGRAGAEAVIIAITDGVALELNLTKVAGEGLTAAKKMSPELAELFSIRKALAKGGTLEKVVAEAFQGFGGGRFGAYRKMKYRTGEFNRFWRRLQKEMGWGDRRLRLDSHHVAESRVMEDNFVKSNEDWQAAFAKLGWKSKDDMFAVALETELHLEKGTRLAEYIGPKAGPAIENLDSLTVALLDEVGRDLSKYPTFESYLIKLEEIYKRPILVKRANSKPVRIAPLWEHMKPAMAEMRKRLNLPPLGD